jgi:translocation and assembly module TamB
VRLLGDGTDIVVDGAVGLVDSRELDLMTEGVFNLTVLESFRNELEARGSSTLELRIRGSLDDPVLRGQMQLENGSLRHRDFANGLSQMNGEVRFNDRLIRIDNLTAASGGGTLRLTGSAEATPEEWNYRLEAQVGHVRLRYPDEVSSVLDGRLTYSGSGFSSLLTGEVLVSRVTVAPQLEMGVILASLSEPTRTPPSNPLLLNMQLDVGITSTPGLSIETTLIRNVAADFDLHLGGTAVNPSMLGRVNITQGQLDFQGTRFEVNRGEIEFLNPFRIDPVVDFEIESRIGTYDIALFLTGPARRLNLSHRSDPPLSFEQMITLVAVGRSPVTDPVLAAQQSLERQYLVQTGANTVLSQALSQTVNRRLQRFFGVSRIKVDPQVGGAEANPSARISTEQQITNNLTLTYSYDLSSAQQQLVRVEYAPTRQWSIIVVRDENGLVGTDVLFRKRFR